MLVSLTTSLIKCLHRLTRTDDWRVLFGPPLVVSLGILTLCIYQAQQGIFRCTYVPRYKFEA